MLLQDVSLYLLQDQFHADKSVDSFEFRGRYLCNYVRRRVKPLKFQTQGFRAILVQGRRDGSEPAGISINENLISPVHFDRPRYLNLKPGEHHEFFISMLIEGLEKAAKSFNIPLNDILGIIEDFRRGGFKNEWVHKAKLLRGTGLRASLLCAMDTERFTLRLKLERKGKTVFDQQILDELPDEICYVHKFKDILLKGNRVIVTQQYAKLPGKKPLFELNLDELSPAID